MFMQAYKPANTFPGKTPKNGYARKIFLLHTYTILDVAMLLTVAALLLTPSLHPFLCTKSTKNL